MTFRFFIELIFISSAVFIVQTSLNCKIIPIVKADKGSMRKTQISSVNNKDSVKYFLQYGEKFTRSIPDSAWFYYEKAHQLAMGNNDKKGLSLFITYAIKQLNNEGKYDQALKMGQQMIEMGKETKDTIMLIKGYNNAANEYEYIGELQQASEYYLTALKYADILGKSDMQQILNNNIASVFIELKDYLQANRYAGKAYVITKTNKDTVAMGSCLINLGITEIHLKKFSSALSHFNMALFIGRQTSDATLIADAKLNRGIIYENQSKLSDARNDYEDVNELARRLKMPDYNLYALFSLGGIEHKKGNYTLAVKYIKQAIAIGKQLSAANELQEMYDTLSVILEKTGDFNGALQFRKKYEMLKDSILNANVRTNINRLQIEYKAAKKDKEIAEKNLQLQKNYSTIEKEHSLLLFSAGGIIFLIVLIIISYRFYRQRQTLNEQTILNYQNEQDMIRLKAIMQGREEERKRISGEMHDDIGSALTTIMYLSNNLNEKDDVNRSKIIYKITSTAGNVVDKMNEIIWSLNKDYDTLDDLITYIRFHVVELLENNGIRYQFIMPDEIPAVTLNGEKRRNIYLVVKESIHNIIKHAEATDVILEFKFDNSLFISIRDNGKGIYLDNLNRFGNGIKNMKNRIENIGGIFSIENNQGTIVNISMPLEVVFAI